MTDVEWIAKMAKVDDPIEALKLVRDNENYFGYDGYYKDIREAILAAVDRAIKKHTP